MARLYDYALQKVSNARLVDVLGHDDQFIGWIKELVDNQLSGDPKSPVAIQSFLQQDAFSLDPSELLENYSEKPDLDGAEVFLINNVTKYYVDHARDLDLKDFVPTFAPPFQKFWVEYETGLDLPPIAGQNKVGILFNAYDHFGWKDENSDEAKVWQESLETDPDNWRWSIEAFVYIGGSNNRVSGPIGCWRFFVSADGSLFKESVDLPKCSAFKNFEDSDAALGLNIALAWLVRPAMLAIGFLHCKNVNKIEHSSGRNTHSKNSRKINQKKNNKYYTLDIEPMKRVLSRDGNIENSGIKHALHICRGHFKNFTPEAPLLGRATGTYWFSSHVRGSKERGVVKKDYSISPPINENTSLGFERIGLDWQTLNEESHFNRNPQNTVRDPAKGERGLNAHSALCNGLADYLKSVGHDPRRPKPSEPQFDIAWELKDELWIVEAKSLTNENEESQLRNALGQIQRYAYHLRQEYTDKAIRMGILVEKKPSQDDWTLTLSELNIELIWPEKLIDRYLGKN
jgi:hypothetical protein